MLKEEHRADKGTVQMLYTGKADYELLAVPAALSPCWPRRNAARC